MKNIKKIKMLFLVSQKEKFDFFNSVFLSFGLKGLSEKKMSK